MKKIYGICHLMTILLCFFVEQVACAYINNKNPIPIIKNANGQSGVPSNANNFHGSINAGVDPRTGKSSFTTKLASFLYDLGKGKRDLVLSYSSGSSAKGIDLLGLGPHWHFNIGYEKPSSSLMLGHMTTDIATGDGHSFTMINENHGHALWHPLRHKLDDVQITGRPGDWTIAMNNGIREHILNGYEDWEENRDGQRVWFYYNRDGSQDMVRHLLYICAYPLTKQQIATNNACDDGIHITYSGDDITVHGQQKIVVHTFNIGGVRTVKSIEMPSFSSDQTKPDKIYFTYDEQGNRPWLLRSVIFPGSRTTFLYNNESSRHTFYPLGLKAGVYGYLPVVTEEITSFNNVAVPNKHIWYRYSNSLTDQHNYTGYLNGLSMEPGKDNLLDRPDNYTYTVSSDNGFTTTATTYNKYHLPLTIVQTNDNYNTKIAENNITYLPWKNTIFSQLPPEFSLPQQTAKTLFALTSKDTNNVQPKQVIMQKTYDHLGRLIWQKDAYGRQIFIEYCPRKGDRFCPAMNPAWPQDLPEKVLVIPATNKALPDPFPVNEKIFNYVHIPINPEYRLQVKRFAKLLTHTTDNGLLKNRQIFTDTIGHDVASNGNLEISKQTLYSLPLSAVNHLQIGDQLPDPPNNKLVVTNYAYDLSHNDNYGQVNQITVQRLDTQSSPKIMFAIFNTLNLQTQTMKHTIGFTKQNSGKHFFYSGTQIYSLQSGLKLAAEDNLNQIKTTWTYDQWNRPVRKISTPVGGIPKITTWQYIVNDHLQAVIKTDPLGNQQKIVYIANGKDILPISTWHRFNHQNWIIDSYNNYTVADKLNQQTSYHADDHGRTASLSSSWGYDDLNRQVWHKLPDGEVNIIARNDPQMLVINYRIADGIKSWQLKIPKLQPIVTVTRENIQGNPTDTYRLSLNPTTTLHGKPLYSKSLQQSLIALKAQLKPLTSLTTLHSYGLLPLAGKNGLFKVVNSIIKSGAWLAHTQNIYDGNGKQIAKILPTGSKVSWQWVKGKLQTLTTPYGSKIHDTYGIEGKITSRCIQPKNGVCHLLGSKKYDSTGSIIEQTDERGQKLKYTYDADHRLTSLSLANHVYTYHYNSYGLTAVDLDGNPYAFYNYDDQWRLIDQEDNIYHIHYHYDEHGNLTKFIIKSPTIFKSLPGIHYPHGQSVVQYNRYNRPIMVQDIKGNIFTYEHDFLGRNISSKVKLPASQVILKQTKWDHYFNRPLSVTNGLGIKRTFSYDDLGTLVKTQDWQHQHLILEQDYHYDRQSGNLVTYARIQGSQNAKETFTYDLQTNNLIQMTCSDIHTNEVGSLCPREIDLQGSNLTNPPVIKAQTYTFDHWNNILQVNEILSTGTKITKYHYAQAKGLYDPHQLIGIQQIWGNQIISQTIKYDKLGRVIEDGAGNTMHYDVNGRMDQFVNQQTGETTKYFYDSNGLQVASWPFDKNHHALQAPLYTLYSNNQPIAQFQDGHYSMELGNGAHSIDGVISSWQITNYKGDVNLELDNHGVIANHVYSPYGMSYNLLHGTSLSNRRHISSQGAWWRTRKLGWNGQLEDPATGYQFLGSGYRAYNPEYRHFMQHDSFSPFKKVNGYGFGDNNPIMANDASGHMPDFLGYIFGGVSIAMGLSSAMLLPIVAAISFSAMNIAAGIAGVIGVVGGAVMASSGALQIMATATPQDDTLHLINNIFGVCSGIGMMAFTVPSLTMGIAELASGVGKLASFIAIINCINSSTFLIGGAGSVAESGIDLAIYKDPSLANEEGLNQALEIIQYISLGLMAINIIFSLTASGLSVIKMFNQKVINNNLSKTTAISDVEVESTATNTITKITARRARESIYQAPKALIKILEKGEDISEDEIISIFTEHKESEMGYGERAIEKLLKLDKVTYNRPLIEELITINNESQNPRRKQYFNKRLNEILNHLKKQKPPEFRPRQPNRSEIKVLRKYSADPRLQTLPTVWEN